MSLEKDISQQVFRNEKHKAAVNIIYTFHWLTEKIREMIGNEDLTLQQYNILRILRGAKGERMNMHTVKARMIDRAPNATRLTDKLLAKGLVERERCDQDRRVVHVRITPKGLDLLRELDKAMRSHWDSVHARLSDADARVVNSALDALRG